MLCMRYFLHLVCWLLVHCDLDSSESVDGEGGGEGREEGGRRGEEEGGEGRRREERGGEGRRGEGGGKRRVTRESGKKDVIHNHEYT